MLLIRSLKFWLSLSITDIPPLEMMTNRAMNLLFTYVGYSRGTWRNLSCHIWSSCFLSFFCDDRMYQSIPSMTSPDKPWAIFLMGKFPTPGQKKSSKPHPWAYKNELKPHPRGYFPQLFTIKT